MEDQLNSQMNPYYCKRKKGKQNRNNRNLKQIQSMDFTPGPHEDPTTPEFKQGQRSNNAT